jgi:hypothetical protein
MASRQRTQERERAAGRAWADALRWVDLGLFIDDNVLGCFDWGEWFDDKPTTAFLNAAFDAAQLREETTL